MDLQDMYARQKRGNQILFTRQSACLQPFRMQICRCDRKTLTLWALTMAQQTAAVLAEKYEQFGEVQTAVQVCCAWAAGRAKMPQAKPYILRVHAMAKRVEDAADAALFHAVGQACSAVHTETHAFGFVLYDCTALVRRAAGQDVSSLLEARLQQYEVCLATCASAASAPDRQWAPFLLREQPNKEFLLLKKEQPDDLRDC